MGQAEKRTKNAKRAVKKAKCAAEAEHVAEVLA
jgi:hypothetical protein